MEDFRIRDDEVVSDLKEQVKRLEARFIGIERQGWHEQVHGATSIDLSGSTIGDNATDKFELTISNTIPRVRKCNFLEFKNRLGHDDGRYAVDALVSGVLLDQEIEEEKTFRYRMIEQGRCWPRGVARKKAEVLAKDASRVVGALRDAQAHDTWIRRIRLQSPTLLRILARVQGESWSSRPRTYYRPFCPLIYCQPMVKKVLAKLEETLASSSHMADATPDASPGGSVTVNQDDYDSVDSSPAAIEVLRCYIDFMDKEIIPDYNRFRNLDYSSNAKIRFSDLCCLFKPGDIIYKPVEGEIPGHRDSRMGQRAWKVFAIDSSHKRYRTTRSDHMNFCSQDGDDDDGNFTVSGFCIDYTGDEFCTITNTFTISPYDAEKPVTALPVFPIRFIPDQKNFMESAMRAGQKVLRSIEMKHATYNAWTVMRTPKGGTLEDMYGSALTHPEHINGEVMVDFAEAFMAGPHWRPEKAVLKPEMTPQKVVNDDLAIRWWSGPDRARMLGEFPELTTRRTGVHSWERNMFVSEDPFLIDVCENHYGGKLTTKEYLRAEDMVLVVCRIFAYVFRERKFAQIDIQRLRPFSRTREALDSLKIPNAVKDLVQGSVWHHLNQRETERQNSEEGLSLDVIQGKGTGLFILLHGVPGVGKTATAEAVAQANGKPLFKITCGDLGLNPDRVESSLKGIFRLASIWDCIILMDEVDTLLSQRSSSYGAITKNALVSS
jgi:hypothetical protein